MMRRSESPEVNLVDAVIGRRLKLRRHTLGLTQSNLADRLGVPASQLQAYETGAVRISAQTLMDVARALATPVGFFLQLDSVDQVEAATAVQH